MLFNKLFRISRSHWHILCIRRWCHSKLSNSLSNRGLEAYRQVSAPQSTMKYHPLQRKGNQQVLATIIAASATNMLGKTVVVKWRSQIFQGTIHPQECVPKWGQAQSLRGPRPRPSKSPSLQETHLLSKAPIPIALSLRTLIKTWQFQMVRPRI